MRYEVSYTDMTYIYDSLMYDNEIYTFPQIMIFKKLETGGKVMRYVFEDGRSIVYLKKDKKMLETLIEELKECKAPQRPAMEYMQHPFSDEDVARLIYACTLISKMLDIECPQLEFRSNRDTYGSSIAEINLVIIQALDNSQECVDMAVRYLAHELRHLWQHKNRPEYFSVPQRELTKEEYLMSPDENDAEAFANKIFYAVTGWDSIRENPEYAGGNATVKERVLALEKDIELDEEVIEKLQMILGFYED